MEGNDQPNEHRDDLLLQDDASIEILSESGHSRTTDSEWSIYSPGRSSIDGSATSLMDFQKVSNHSKMATIVHYDGRQFIERRDLDDGGLPYSAEFYLNGEVWKLSGEDCFLISPRRYIALVAVEDTVDLEGAVTFEQAVETLLKQLKVQKVLLDKELEECNRMKSVLLMTVDNLTDGSDGNIDRKRDAMLLRMLLRKHGKDFKHDLTNCSHLSSGIMTTLDDFITKAFKLIQRNVILGHLNDSSLSVEFINDAFQKALDQHRSRLAAICTSPMKDKLNEFPDDYIIYVTTDDMQLFADLTTFNDAMFKAVWPTIFSKFLTKVQEINDKQFLVPGQQSNRIFLYVCKSMQEVAKQLGGDSVIIYSEALGWEVTNLKEDHQTQSSYGKCLRQQLQMLAKMANHFEPGAPLRTSPFPYELKLFQYMNAIPEPVRIWLCLLDDYMKDLVQADRDKMQMLSPFFRSYVSCIASEDFRNETVDCLRKITHDALRSLTSLQRHQTMSDSIIFKYKKRISCCWNTFLREKFGIEWDHIETTRQQNILKAMNIISIIIKLGICFGIIMFFVYTILDIFCFNFKYKIFCEQKTAKDPFQQVMHQLAEFQKQIYRRFDDATSFLTYWTK